MSEMQCGSCFSELHLVTGNYYVCEDKFHRKWTVHKRSFDTPMVAEPYKWKSVDNFYVENGRRKFMPHASFYWYFDQFDTKEESLAFIEKALKYDNQ